MSLLLFVGVVRNRFSIFFFVVAKFLMISFITTVFYNKSLEGAKEIACGMVLAQGLHIAHTQVHASKHTGPEA